MFVSRLRASHRHVPVVSRVVFLEVACWKNQAKHRDWLIYIHTLLFFLLFTLLLTYLYCAYRSRDICFFSGINYLDTSHLLT